MGGAFAALGSDIASASLNPAGLGLYRGCDMNITLSYDRSDVDASFLNVNQKSYMNRFTSTSAGAVFTFPNRDNYTTGKGKLNTVISVAYNRQEALYQRLNGFGINNGNTFLNGITDYYNANPEYWDVFGGADALWIDDEGLVHNEFGDAGAPNIYQDFYRSQKGSIDDISVSYATNYSNRLFFGMSFGFTTIDHDETWSLVEEDALGSVGGSLRQYEYENLFERNGLGVNIKAGFLYAVTPSLKLSIGVHTPSVITVDEMWDETVYTSFNNNTSGFDSDFWYTRYTLITPTRLVFGASYVVAGRLLLSADYEGAPFGGMRLEGDSYDYTDINSSISRNFGWRNAVRGGAELRLGPALLRGGGFLYTSPFAKGSDRQVAGFSAGLGFRFGDYYTDIAYQWASTSDKYQFDGTPASQIDIAEAKQNVLFTMGVRF